MTRTKTIVLTIAAALVLMVMIVPAVKAQSFDGIQRRFKEMTKELEPQIQKLMTDGLEELRLGE